MTPSKWLKCIAIIFVLLAIIMCYKGHDRMVNYSNPDEDSYSHTYTNAYVGGDAYNYIINGTHAAAFFVLSVGFLLTGAVCGCTGFVLDKMNENTPKEEATEIPTEPNDLPEL